MTIRMLIGRTAVVAAAVAAFGASVQAQSLTPSSIDLTLAPGETFTEMKTLTIPGDGLEIPVDIYFLADNTGSMGSVIDEVKANALFILNEINGLLPDAQFGVGAYRDFPFGEGNFAFRHITDITSNTTAVQDGIDEWQASGGGDTSEGQFFALTKIADPSDPENINFRDGALKVIVWFGDAPGHDPICVAISGESDDITEASVTALLMDNGFRVLAIGTTTGVADALNADPETDNSFIFSYDGTCLFDGAAGQAARIATATDGQSFQDVDPNDITDAILTAIENLVLTVDVALVPDGDTAPYTEVLTPPYMDVVVPPPGESIDLQFEIRFTGPPCDESGENVVRTGVVNALIEDTISAQQDVTLRSQGCVPFSCVAGGPYIVDCDTSDGMVQLDATIGDIFEGDGPIFMWSTDCAGSIDDPSAEDPTLMLDLTDCPFECSVTLVVDDGLQNFATCTALVTVSEPQDPPTTQPGDDDDMSDGQADCGAGLCGFGTLGMAPFMFFGLALMKARSRRRA